MFSSLLWYYLLFISLFSLSDVGFPALIVEFSCPFFSFSFWLFMLLRDIFQLFLPILLLIPFFLYFCSCLLSRALIFWMFLFFKKKVLFYFRDSSYLSIIIMSLKSFFPWFSLCSFLLFILSLPFMLETSCKAGDPLLPSLLLLLRSETPKSW